MTVADGSGALRNRPSRGRVGFATRAAALLAMLIAWGALAGVPRAAAQTNFKPLERGDYKETEEKVIVIRGMEVGGDYALRFMEFRGKDVGAPYTDTQADQDFRLRFGTLFNELVSMRLTLDVGDTTFNDADLRSQSPTLRRQTERDANIGLAVREAYLNWRFNPNSAIRLGQHEQNLGDKRGKTYVGLAPGIGFDCRIGTWCMPLGMLRISPSAADWVYHWALQYRAWDEERAGFRHALEVEIFRIIYTEKNVPLGKNLGPTYYDPSDPRTPNATQATDDFAKPLRTTKDAIYYDVSAQNYFGLRLNLEAGRYFWNADVTSAQGSRRYHLYRDPATGVVPGAPDYSSATERVIDSRKISGLAYETELGWRWARGRLGLRYMNASGDPAVGADNGRGYLRGLQGFYEITPGSYRGSRLYFNGTDSDVSAGSGLGHSINNTRLLGFFLDYADAESNRMAYSLGVYSLDLNHAIVNEQNDRVTRIGVEVDNMLTWYLPYNLQFQAELNLLQAQGAFRLDDFSTPSATQPVLIQGVARLLYHF
ncbi:MAG: hypothetical protein HY423_10830 [Candidatus Lambdaproteobacteria bacterium]|nr:hypothetical protein [Candidatus Lambdaproteobacteria bacterium]